MERALACDVLISSRRFHPWVEGFAVWCGDWMTSAAGARGCLVGACAGRCPSQADPGEVIKRNLGSGVASIRGGVLWWTRRRRFRAASRQHRELRSPWAHRGPSGDDDEEAGSALGARTPRRWRPRTSLGRWLRIGGALRFGAGRRSGGAVEQQGVAHADRLAAPGRMPQAEVADLVKALGQNMLEIAAHELVPRDPAGPGPFRSRYWKLTVSPSRSTMRRSVSAMRKT